MTREELLRALYEPWRYDEPYDLIERAREQIEADEKKNAAILKKLRSDVFEILRRHDVSDQCFAEVAAVTYAALVGKEQ
jgi:hypothetical protein